MKITDEELNDKAHAYASKKHPNPFFSEMRNISAQDYAAGYRAAESADKWVPVTNAYPEENEVVMWCKHPVEEPYYVGTMLDDDFIPDYYTHWQPLPAPPQTETGL